MTKNKRRRQTRAKRYVLELNDILQLGPCREGLVRALMYLDNKGLVAAPENFMNDVRSINRYAYNEAPWRRLVEQAPRVRISLNKELFTSRTVADDEFRHYVEKLLMSQNRPVWYERVADKLEPVLQRRAVANKHNSLEDIRDRIAQTRASLSQLEARQKALEASQPKAIDVLEVDKNPWRLCENSRERRSVAEALVEVLREQEDRG